MSSIASNQQIVALYESSLGEFSPEDIYEAMNGELKLESIKIALMNGSQLYRERMKSKKEVFTNEDFDAAQKVISGLMYSADSDITKFRAAKLVLDERLGRRDVRGVKNMNFSVTLINQELKMVDEAIKKAKEKIIDIDPKHEHLKSIAA